MTKSLASKVLPPFVRNAINRSIDPHVTKRADGRGPCSRKTERERRQGIMAAIAQLWELGFHVQKLESLSQKHIEALVHSWHEQGVAAGTLHTRLSMLRVLCEWLGKPNVVKDITDYLPKEEVRRHTVAKESKAWDAKAVDPLLVIELANQIDERLAVMLSMQHFFGLRVKESIEIRPSHVLVDGGKALEIREGTKGGRLRRISIDSPEQQRVIEWASRVAATGHTKRLRWTDCTFLQAQNRFYNLVRKRLGITAKAMGVTAHGLRHGYAQREYRNETGLPTPIEGGALGRIDREKHLAASLNVSRALGHGRIDVTTAYYGSYRHGLRVKVPTTMTFQFNSKSDPD